MSVNTPVIDGRAEAAQRLLEFVNGGRFAWRDGDITDFSALRDDLRVVGADTEQLVRDAWGALNFILAFYEPGQRYLDTEAWKNCEANARAVHKRLGEAMANLTPGDVL